MPLSDSTFEAILAVDALYFHAARAAYARALTALEGIESANSRWKSLEQEILDMHGGNEFEAYDDLERVYIQMESAEYEIGKAHAPLLKDVASVHILCAASLEAHINTLAGDALHGVEARAFEWLRLEAKWLFLPKLQGYAGFDPGRQPFQRFSKLVNHRNELVHFKGKRESWRAGSVPTFVSDLGLTIGDAEESLRAVEEMIREFATQRGVESPFWLREDLTELSYFEAKLVRRSRRL